MSMGACFACSSTHSGEEIEGTQPFYFRPELSLRASVWETETIDFQRTMLSPRGAFMSPDDHRSCTMACTQLDVYVAELTWSGVFPRTFSLGASIILFCQATVGALRACLNSGRDAGVPEAQLTGVVEYEAAELAAFETLMLQSQDAIKSRSFGSQQRGKVRPRK